ADLGRFLNALGAKIEGLGTSTIEVTGVEQLGGADFRVIPDRIETATLLIAAAMTRGSIQVAGVVPGHLTAVLRTLDAAGAALEVGADRISLFMNGRPRSFNAIARPYPGIPTDVQAQLMSLAAFSDGASRLADRVFPERFQHVPELIRLGAAIERRGDRTLVTGIDSLVGTEVTASDLRASAALVLAGLAARGTTIVGRIDHLDRGYERLDAKLNQLGARIERIADNEPALCERQPSLARHSQVAA
ncbi:MAG TPA: UDP-N-acetylglucosamine 1-carboxyvinyltransferase, partial [Pirellulales bacterium]|nr:UDP-N-acetylglucosamine 1-carboxyvinyltransferase [Pirellulales bacterium]